MEHGEKADLGAQMLGISGDGEQGFRRGPEQNAIELSLILIGDAAICSGRVKTTWKYSSVQEFGLAVLEPLSPGERLAFRAVPIPAGNGELSITCLMGSLF